MSTDWIKMRVDLRTHPKVVRMSSALRADKLRVIGGLFATWAIFDAHSSDGVLEGYTFRALDEELNWKGFSQAMANIGWLEDLDGQGLTAPRFGEHNGQSAKRRAQETERKRLDREAEKKSANVGQMSASDADKKRTREEKRREEQISPSLRSGEAPRANALACPDGVTERTWSDWLKLRKAKKAPVTETVLLNARDEALAAGVSLERFLSIWCSRGSQGLQADWLKPHERGIPPRSTSGGHSGFDSKDYHAGANADGSF